MKQYTLPSFLIQLLRAAIQELHVLGVLCVLFFNQHLPLRLPSLIHTTPTQSVVCKHVYVHCRNVSVLMYFMSPPFRSVLSRAQSVINFNFKSFLN